MFINVIIIRIMNNFYLPNPYKLRKFIDSTKLNVLYLSKNKNAINYLYKKKLFIILHNLSNNSNAIKLLQITEDYIDFY